MSGGKIRISAGVYAAWKLFSRLPDSPDELILAMTRLEPARFVERREFRAPVFFTLRQAHLEYEFRGTELSRDFLLIGDKAATGEWREVIGFYPLTEPTGDQT